MEVHGLAMQGDGHVQEEDYIMGDGPVPIDEDIDIASRIANGVSGICHRWCGLVSD